jgi:type-F conjugative transfer system pilin assembly protein TrbC
MSFKIIANPDSSEILELLKAAEQGKDLYLKEAEALNQKATHPLKKSLGLCECEASKQTSGCFAKDPKNGVPHSGTLSILVSLSMPKGSLQSLYQEAEAQGAILVLRGLKNNSFRETAQTIKELGIGIQINPSFFKEHQVKVVPTFLWVDDQQNTHLLSGNISLAYAKEKLKGFRP